MISITIDRYTKPEKKRSKINHRKYDGMQIFLDTGRIATSPCHMWCNAFEPLGEAFFIPGTFQFILYECKESQMSFQCQTTKFIKIAGKNHNKFECSIEMSSGTVCYFSACSKV